MRAADRASPCGYEAGLLAMVLVCGGVSPVRPAANATAQKTMVALLVTVRPNQRMGRSGAF